MKLRNLLALTLCSSMGYAANTLSDSLLELYAPEVYVSNAENARKSGGKYIDGLGDLTVRIEGNKGNQMARSSRQFVESRKLDKKIGFNYGTRRYVKGRRAWVSYDISVTGLEIFLDFGSDNLVTLRDKSLRGYLSDVIVHFCKEDPVHDDSTDCDDMNFSRRFYRHWDKKGDFFFLLSSIPKPRDLSQGDIKNFSKNGDVFSYFSPVWTQLLSDKKFLSQLSLYKSPLYLRRKFVQIRRDGAF